MIEIRFHGRGGQGTVVASKALAEAIALEDRYVQTFPEYGVERRGAPVMAYTRIDNKPIYIRSKVYTPNYVIVMDPTLIGAVDVAVGLKSGGSIIINTEKRPEDYKNFIDKGYKVYTIDATSIAIKHRLGSKASPIVNTAMLGAVAAYTGLVGLNAVVEGVRKLSPVKKDENVMAAKEAYKIAEEVKNG